MWGSILQCFGSPFECRSVSFCNWDNALSKRLHCANNVSEIMRINTYFRPQCVGFGVYEYVLDVFRSCFPPRQCLHHRCVVGSKYGLVSPHIYEANLTDDVLSLLNEGYSRRCRCVCLGSTLLVCLQPAPSTTTWIYQRILFPTMITIPYSVRWFWNTKYHNDTPDALGKTSNCTAIWLSYWRMLRRVHLLKII